MGRAYDVVVVGAGPAGSTAAYITAKAGLSTLLTEKRQEIGSPVRCAETISRVKLPEFVKPESQWISNVVHAARIVAPDGNAVDVVRHKNHEEGFVLNRKVFDRRLAELAALAGAHVRVKTRVVGLHMDGDKVTGVRIRSGGSDEEVQARIVIGADGVESQVGRWAGLPSGPGLSDISVCVQYVMTGVEIEDEDHLHIYLGSEISPGGYAWAFPKGSKAWNIGLGIRPLVSGAQGRTAKYYLDTFVARKFPGAVPVSLVMGAVPIDGRLFRISGNGVMLVGDAAHQVNPLTGSGITNGMRCAVMAGETAVAACSRGDVSEKELSQYDRRYRKDLGRKFKALARVRDAMSLLTDEDLNRIVSRAGRGDARSWFEFLKTAVGKDPMVIGALMKLAALGYFESRTDDAGPGDGDDEE
ncbi:MAG: NAD(P)/FAD-dependent oxidoreductase [Pseudomonadota bacterium]